MDKNHSNRKIALKNSAPQKRKKSDFVYEESSSKNETPVVLLVDCKFCNHKFKFMSQLGEDYNQKCPMCPRQFIKGYTQSTVQCLGQTVLKPYKKCVTEK